MRLVGPVLLALATAATAPGCRAGVKDPARLANAPRWAPPAAAAPTPAAPTAGTPPPAAGTSDADPWFHSFRGKSPPELAADGTWISGGPATLASLRGRVVYLQFAFLRCGGCIPMMPFLNAWHHDYASRGLTVVYVDNAGVDRLEDARHAVRDEHLPFAFFHDTSGKTVRAYGVRAFPTGYLLDRKGSVVWEGSPGGQETNVEAAIQAALR